MRLELAQEQAAAHIKSIKCSFEDYIKRFQKKRLKLLKTATQSAPICKDNSPTNNTMLAWSSSLTKPVHGTRIFCLLK
jgi:hypothetical protein